MQHTTYYAHETSQHIQHSPCVPYMHTSVYTGHTVNVPHTPYTTQHTHHSTYHTSYKPHTNTSYKPHTLHTHTTPHIPHKPHTPYTYHTPHIQTTTHNRTKCHNMPYVHTRLPHMNTAPTRCTQMLPSPSAACLAPVSRLSSLQLDLSGAPSALAGLSVHPSTHPSSVHLSIHLSTIRISFCPLSG